MSAYDKLPDPERLPPPKQKKTESERIASFLTEVGGNVNPQAGECLKKAEPAFVAVIQVITIVAPIYKQIYTKIYEVYVILPKNVIQMIFGLCLCFFGGTYVAAIAAVEAFRQLGWQTVSTNLVVVQKQAALILEASKKDDKVDDDGDGVADVDQIEARALVQRKIQVGMKAITEPDRLQTACGALFTSYLAVLATLRLEFARTTAFALGIVEMAKFPIIRIVSPTVAATLGADLAHWTQSIIESSLTFVAVIFAWFLQQIISAFYSGLRGGRMFADGLIAELEERDLMSKVPLIKQPFDPDESFLDETIGYAIAAVGFIFQITNGFRLPFPLNIIFLPLTILEWILRLQISMEGSKALV